MDSIEIILLLAFILFSLFGRSKKKKRPAPASQSAEKKEKQPSFFDEILRELEEQAQQGTQRDPEPVRVEVDIKQSPHARKPVSKESRFADEDTFEQLQRGYTPHEEHGFGPDSPFSEETFERLPPDPAPPLHEAGHLTQTPHVSLGKPLARQDIQQTSSIARRWRKRLQNPERARDAIVLKEIFDGPRTFGS